MNYAYFDDPSPSGAERLSTLHFPAAATVHQLLPLSFGLRGVVRSAALAAQLLAIVCLADLCAFSIQPAVGEDLWPVSATSLPVAATSWRRLACKLLPMLQYAPPPSQTHNCRP